MCYNETEYQQWFTEVQTMIRSFSVLIQTMQSNKETNKKPPKT